MLDYKINSHNRRKPARSGRSGSPWRLAMWTIGLCASLFTFPVVLQPALGSDFDGKSLGFALSAVHDHLSKQGSGLVDRHETCPKNDQTEWGFKFVRAIDLKPIDGTRTAVLIDTNQCSGGNESGQYLAIAIGPNAQLILKDFIGDMRFAITQYHVGDNSTLQLKGLRWKENDPHCCPSQKGTLSYNLATGATNYQPN